MNEPNAQDRERTQLIAEQQQAWESFAASFAQKWKEAAHAREAQRERKDDRAVD
jgi:hypothetical protein